MARDEFLSKLFMGVIRRRVSVDLLATGMNSYSSMGVGGEETKNSSQSFDSLSLRDYPQSVASVLEVSTEGEERTLNQTIDQTKTAAASERMEVLEKVLDDFFFFLPFSAV